MNPISAAILACVVATSAFIIHERRKNAKMINNLFGKVVDNIEAQQEETKNKNKDE